MNNLFNFISLDTPGEKQNIKNIGGSSLLRQVPLFWEYEFFTVQDEKFLHLVVDDMLKDKNVSVEKIADLAIRLCYPYLSPEAVLECRGPFDIVDDITGLTQKDVPLNFYNNMLDVCTAFYPDLRRLVILAYYYRDSLKEASFNWTDIYTKLTPSYHVIPRKRDDKCKDEGKDEGKDESKSEGEDVLSMEECEHKYSFAQKVNNNIFKFRKAFRVEAQDKGGKDNIKNKGGKHKVEFELLRHFFVNDKMKVYSLYDAEFVFGVTRSGTTKQADGSKKNPFIGYVLAKSNNDSNKYRSDLKRFLQNFNKMNFTAVCLKRSPEYCVYNQFILERVSNINFINSLYLLKGSSTSRYSDRYSEKLPVFYYELAALPLLNFRTELAKYCIRRSDPAFIDRMEVFIENLLIFGLPVLNAVFQHLMLFISKNYKTEWENIVKTKDDLFNCFFDDTYNFFKNEGTEVIPVQAGFPRNVIARDYLDLQCNVFYQVDNVAERFSNQEEKLKTVLANTHRQQVDILKNELRKVFESPAKLPENIFTNASGPQRAGIEDRLFKFPFSSFS